MGGAIVGKAALLVGRLFASSSEEVCNSVYMKNILIIKHLRAWLPLAPWVFGSGVHPSQNNITHQHYECTRNIIYALSNIAATSIHYIELFISTDVFITLLHLYKLTPVSVRVEIAHVLYNIFYLIHYTTIASILRQCRPTLLEVLRDMLEEKNPIILRLAMDIICFSCDSLPSVGNLGMKKTS